MLIFPCRYTNQPQKLSVKNYQEQQNIQHLPSVLVSAQPKTNKQMKQNYDTWFNTDNIIREINYKNFWTTEGVARQRWGYPEISTYRTLPATRTGGTKEVEQLLKLQGLATSGSWILLGAERGGRERARERERARAFPSFHHMLILRRASLFYVIINYLFIDFHYLFYLYPVLPGEKPNWKAVQRSLRNVVCNNQIQTEKWIWDQ